MTYKEFYYWLDGYLTNKLESEKLNIAPIIEKMGQVNDNDKIGIAEPYRIPIPVNPFPIKDGIQIKGEYYWEFVDEGVKGVFNQSKAPNSQFSFKNLGVPPDMLSSFKQYISRTGSRGLRKQKLIRKNKKKQADLIEKEAMAMAVATKIGGIKPMNFKDPAVGAKRLKVLNKALSKEMATTIRLAIIK
jgi:hypothetical protein